MNTPLSVDTRLYALVETHRTMNHRQSTSMYEKHISSNQNVSDLRMECN